MKKEALIAIFLGLGIGALIALGIFTARRAMKKHNALSGAAPAPAADISPSPTPAAKHFLTVSHPIDHSVVNEKNLNVAGSTSAEAVVAISAEETDLIIQADSAGQFSREIDLIGGINNIRVVSFSSGGEREEAELVVVYSTADF